MQKWTTGTFSSSVDLQDLACNPPFIMWPLEGDTTQELDRAHDGAETQIQPRWEIILIFFLLFSVPARPMIQRSRPPKTSQMRSSVSFASTLSCTILSTLWPVGQCSHVSKWTTPWLRSWWTGLWQKMDSMKLCFWEQVRRKPFTNY